MTTRYFMDCGIFWSPITKSDYDATMRFIDDSGEEHLNIRLLAVESPHSLAGQTATLSIDDLNKIEAKKLPPED